MNRTSITRCALALCLLATPLLAIGDHHMDNDMDRHMNQDMDRHMDDDMNHRGGSDGTQGQGGRHYDPVQRADKHLKGLEQKLNLKADQQSAWNTYSGAVRAQAREQAARMEEFHGKRSEMRDLDTASKLERMAQWMRERANHLDRMAKETRTFQDGLTTEQQTIFDLYWEKHARRDWGRGR